MWNSINNCKHNGKPMSNRQSWSIKCSPFAKSTNNRIRYIWQSERVPHPDKPMLSLSIGKNKKQI